MRLNFKMQKTYLHIYIRLQQISYCYRWSHVVLVAKRITKHCVTEFTAKYCNERAGE